ncbi:MAG TPA: MFS transporter [Planctomycetota bacterium]|nr:MFS transporter [Planctomycetota bacterium]
MNQGALKDASGAELITDSAMQAPTRVRYRVMAFLCALSFLTYFDRVCIIRAQQDIQRDLNITDQQMGWVLGIFWFAYGMFEIPGGWLGDRFGPRSSLMRIVLAWSLFTALSGSAIGFVTLFICRLCFGIGEAGAYPNMAAVQARWVPLAQRARFGGLLWLCARWGGAFSPILFGIVLSYIDSAPAREFLRSMPLLSALSDVPSWRFGFWGAGLLGVFWCAAFYPWFRDLPSQSKEVNAAERRLLPDECTRESHSIARSTWVALFSSRSLWGLALYYFCGGFGWSFFVSWVPRYMKDTHHVEFHNSEWMAALPLFVGGLACIVGGTICDLLVVRTGRKRLVRACFPIIGCLVASSAMFFIRSAESAYQAAFLMCLAAGAFDMGQSANWASIVDIGGRHAGLAAGFINMIGNLGGFAQPIIGAYIFNAFGWNAMFGVYACAFLLAASMWLFINPERTFHSEAQPERH